MVTRRQFLQGAAALTLLGGLDPRGTFAAPRGQGSAAALTGMATNGVSPASAVQRKSETLTERLLNRMVAAIRQI